MKKLLYLLPVSLLLCSCSVASTAILRSIAIGAHEGYLPLVLYELFTTVLPLFLALVIQLPSKRHKDYFDRFGVFAFIAGVLSFITYFVSEDIAALIGIAVLAGVPLVTRMDYGVSWGRAFGTLGLFILFSFITELIVNAIFE